MGVNTVPLLALAAVLCICAANAQPVNTTQAASTDRRIPYYVVPGCDYMLSAEEQCDASKYPPAVACCPLGYECLLDASQNVSKCLPSTPTYDLSPDCRRSKRALPDAECGADSCCPDGLDCVSSTPTGPSTCQWTGRAVLPPKGYKASPAQLSRDAFNRLENTPLADTTDSDVAPKADDITDRQTPCATGYRCPATTLPASSCNRAGARWQAPSCRCYDTPSPAAMAGAPPALDVDSVGRITIRGTTNLANVQSINYFGFNNGQTMVDGLWAGYQNASIGDFPTVLKRIRLLGFNGIRLPFTFADLDRAPSQNMYATNCRVDTVRQFRQSLTPTYTAVSSTASRDVAAVYLSPNACPYDTNPTETAQGSLSTANKHVPGRQDTTTWNRFMWIVQYAVGQGFYVTIDFHFEQANLQSNPALFASEWRRLWTDMVSLPTFSSRLSGRVFPELANEWDKFGCRWDTPGGPDCSAPYRQSIEAAAAAIRDVSRAAGVSTPLILINGVGQTNYGYSWGDGFVTDSARISQSGLSNPQGFFLADSASANKYRIALAPHVYGPSVTGQSAAAATGNLLWERLFASWGSKSPAASLARAGIRQQYPVIITEFGSDCDLYNGLSSASCQAGDARHLQDLAAYFLNTAGVVPLQYSHLRNTFWHWWCWNANSGDTGGMVTGSGPGAWYNIKWYKVRYLETLGLCPWYKAASSCA